MLLYIFLKKEKKKKSIFTFLADSKFKLYMIKHKIDRNEKYRFSFPIIYFDETLIDTRTYLTGHCVLP